MLGRMRPSSISSLELLVLERPNSKISKDDSFSIYESTLLKLKQGSLHNRSISLGNSTETDVNFSMANDSSELEVIMDADCSSTESLPSSSGCECAGTSKYEGTRNLSIIDLFSRYKNSQRSASSIGRVDILAGSAFSSPSVSPSSSNGQLLSRSRQY